MSKIVWTNGCFDVLHRGHIELFKFAREVAGDDGTVIVGIDTDDRVSKMKGPTRPFNRQYDRKFVLQSIMYIDKVVYFKDEQKLISLIKKYNCDIMIVGSDWKNKRVVGSENVSSVLYFERMENYSTTKILEGKRDICF
jgi:D-beta-D-heptose 7-phosphate kinase/D-beta-D-heptose 1-phosphate adenosyltransferase